MPLGQIVNGTARSKRKAGERNDAQLGRLAQAFRDKDNAERDLRSAEAAYARELEAAETVKGVTPDRLADARLVKAGGSWYEVGPIKAGAKTAKVKGLDYRVPVAKIVDVKTNDDLRREWLTKAGLDPNQAPTTEQAKTATEKVSALRVKAADVAADNPDLARLHNEHADVIAAHLLAAVPV